MRTTGWRNSPLGFRSARPAGSRSFACGTRYGCRPSSAPPWLRSWLTRAAGLAGNVLEPEALRNGPRSPSSSASASFPPFDYKGLVKGGQSSRSPFARIALALQRRLVAEEHGEHDRPAALHHGGSLLRWKPLRHAGSGRFGSSTQALVSRRVNAHRTRGARNGIQNDIGGVCPDKQC